MADVRLDDIDEPRLEDIAKLKAGVESLAGGDGIAEPAGDLVDQGEVAEPALALLKRNLPRG